LRLRLLLWVLLWQGALCKLLQVLQHQLLL
jgi:hypothetical protein